MPFSKSRLAWVSRGLGEARGLKRFSETPTWTLLLVLILFPRCRSLELSLTRLHASWPSVASTCRPGGTGRLLERGAEREAVEVGEGCTWDTCLEGGDLALQSCTD